METIRDIGYRDELARLTPNLRRFARALVRNHQTDVADDLVQATLARALSGDQTQRGMRLQVWLVSLLVGLHREQVRDLRMEQRLGFAGGEPPISATSWKGVRRNPALLSSVPLEYREALLLVVLEGMSYPQAAEALGLSTGTVATRVARARDYLGRAQANSPGGDVGPTPAGKTTRGVPSYLRVVK
jgi:RNA polymerase sigma-70 factor, ECF subfamily